MLWSNRLLQKYCIFKIKKFFLPNYCWSVLVLLFCVYEFLRALFQFCHDEITNSFYLEIYIGSHLASHQIMSYNKRIHSHGWQLQAVVFFLFSEETKFEFDTISIILSYIYNSRNISKSFWDTVNRQHIKPCHMTK